MVTSRAGAACLWDKRVGENPVLAIDCLRNVSANPCICTKDFGFTLIPGTRGYSVNNCVVYP